MKLVPVSRTGGCQTIETSHRSTSSSPSGAFKSREISNWRHFHTADGHVTPCLPEFSCLVSWTRLAMSATAGARVVHRPHRAKRREREKKKIPSLPSWQLPQQRQQRPLTHADRLTSGSSDQIRRMLSEFFFFILIRWSTLSLCPTLTFSHLSVVSLFFFKTKFKLNSVILLWRNLTNFSEFCV